MSDKLSLNSKNSSIPPSQDPNKENPQKNKSGKSSGGQKGHEGKTLKNVDNPDEEVSLEIDRRTLPPGSYKSVGIEKRQVIDVQLKRIVTEYQAEVLINTETGEMFVASFPDNVSQAVQYGNQVKALSVYLSQYQLIPYNRIHEFFKEQVGIPVSEGSIYRFNLEAYEKSERAETITKEKLSALGVMHADETGANINGVRHWLHCASNEQWTFFHADKKRGSEAFDRAGVIPKFNGVLIHDHWKPYYKYTDCCHSLCNGHHLRELMRAHEQDGQQWAAEMKKFLENLNIEVNQAHGRLSNQQARKRRKQYRDLLRKSEIECPPPDDNNSENKRGRTKRTKSRNLLERLINFERDVLRFVVNKNVPFTNNLAERDVRMTKVHQKISGCFRSQKGAEIFCRVRGYISTCRKNNVGARDAILMLFNNELPSFF